MSTETNVLELTDDELAILSKLYWSGLISGEVSANPICNNLGDKMKDAFADAFDATFGEVLVSRPPGSYVNAAAVIADVRKYREKQNADLENTIQFNYHGATRVVQNPDFRGNKVSGVELTRAGRKTGQYKHYLISDIQGL
jgi:hypothetical protein